MGIHRGSPGPELIQNAGEWQTVVLNGNAQLQSWVLPCANYISPPGDDRPPGSAGRSCLESASGGH